MRTSQLLRLRLGIRLAVIVGIGTILATGQTTILAQTAPATLSPGLAEVVKLSQAHMSDDVILNFLKGRPGAYHLTADDILYLNQQGVSQPVISALLQSGGGSPAPAPVTAPPPAFAPGAAAPPPTAGPAPIMPASPAPSGPAADASFSSFHDQLAPYGTWLEIPGYGWSWRPAEAAMDPSWRPYSDRGHWVYSDDGWFWQSDYAWGVIPFHYGRWFSDARYGWLWAPDYTWGPAWVCWRHAEGYCGWAPLPPGARFEAGVGLVFRNGRVAADFDFGLSDRYFTFVAYNHFWEPDLRLHILPRAEVSIVFRNSHVFNDFRIVNGRFINEGIGRERIALYTHRPVERVYVRELVRPGPVRIERVERGERIERNPRNDHGDKNRDDRKRD